MLDNKALTTVFATAMRCLIGATLVAGATGTLTSCKKGSAPNIIDVGDQVAVVGQTLTLHIFASDPDGDSLDYSFHSEGLPDVDATTSMSVAPDGHGVFTFTPLASQIGSRLFDFNVSDGKNESTLTINIEVRGAVGSGSLPIFRKPLGSGTVLDLEQADCVDFEIEVEDPDSASVILEATPPIIQDSNLSTDASGMSGEWSWCPNREQKEGPDRYDLTLTADDMENPAQEKDYIIVLRKRQGLDCPGDFPEVEHSPRDFSTLLDLQIDAHVTDTEGLGDAPLLLYSFEDPGDPIDFSIMTLVEMNLESGDMRDGMWRGFIPNPTAAAGEGAEATVYYLVSASDNDDIEGDCDHRVDNPERGVHDVSVVNNGEGGAGVCEGCSADVQCGGEGDLCLVQDSEGYCGSACADDGECGDGFICSPEPVSSIDGAAARQCIKNSGDCSSSGNGGACEDDGRDDSGDDTPDEASALGTVGPGDQSGTLCPDDEDWYQIEIAEEAEVTVTLSGDAPPDMDVSITDAAGVLIKQSIGLTSDEELTTTCLDPGTYYMRVFSVDNEQGSYTVSYSADPSTCGQVIGEGDCCEDNNTPGCEDSGIQACVCGMDDFCCDFEWDETCANIAKDECGADCGGSENLDCCTDQETPGCTDTAIEACVCDDDPWCCGNDSAGVGVWDQFCVAKVGSLLCGSPCTPDDDDGDCCEDNGTPGCNVNTVEECVCEADPLCCSLGWDALCVVAIMTEECGSCPS